jgi:two-component system alkaline phosphatase synthesis response regulator PhoP
MATRVLLIEDEPILVSLYATMLAKEGYEVLTALNLEAGEEKVIVIRPHLILLDLLIPKKQGSESNEAEYHEPLGFQILRLVKGTPSLKDTRVIILSNLDSDEHIKTAKDLGADAYLIKSNIDPHDLKGHVERILQS